MQAIALGATVFTVAMLVLIRREFRAAAVWGVLWGEVLGFAIVAPASLSVHHLYPAGLVQWTIVWTFFGTVFALLGCLLAVLGSVPVALLGLRSRDTWSGLLALKVVPLGYIGISYGLEWVNFGQPPAFRPGTRPPVSFFWQGRTSLRAPGVCT